MEGGARRTSGGSCRHRSQQSRASFSFASEKIGLRGKGKGGGSSTLGLRTGVGVWGWSGWTKCTMSSATTSGLSWTMRTATASRGRSPMMCVPLDIAIQRENTDARLLLFGFSPPLRTSPDLDGRWCFFFFFLSPKARQRLRAQIINLKLFASLCDRRTRAQPERAREVPLNRPTVQFIPDVVSFPRSRSSSLSLPLPSLPARA